MVSIVFSRASAFRWVRVACIAWYGATIFAAQPARAQSDGYKSEFTFGINENTAGWFIGGVAFKLSKKGAKSPFFTTYGIEIVNVRHPQEQRVRAATGNFFIYGKRNYLYAVRLQYGRDLILFRKADRSGVEIKGGIAIGPSIGIVAPYYIQWLSSFREIQHSQYDPNNPQHSYPRIVGPGFLLEGFSQSKIQMGGNLKIGFSFEMGVSKSSTAGFEIGAILDAYFNKVVMVPTAEALSFFPAFYLTFFYGSRR